MAEEHRFVILTPMNFEVRLLSIATVISLFLVCIQFYIFQSGTDGLIAPLAFGGGPTYLLLTFVGLTIPIFTFISGLIVSVGLIQKWQSIPTVLRACCIFNVVAVFIMTVGTVFKFL